MFIKPKDGVVVPYPAPRRDSLPPAGAEVPEGDLYWQRRLLDGDVIRDEPAAKAAKKGS